jgi:hypothetical protein
MEVTSAHEVVSPQRPNLVLTANVLRCNIGVKQNIFLHRNSQEGHAQCFAKSAFMGIMPHPHVEGDVLEFDGLHVEPHGGDAFITLFALEVVYNRCMRTNTQTRVGQSFPRGQEREASISKERREGENEGREKHTRFASSVKAQHEDTYFLPSRENPQH